VASSTRKLRSGYTTGACAAAATKAATTLLFREEAGKHGNKEVRKRGSREVEIPFPDGSRVKFRVHYSGISDSTSGPVASASVIKDAGDDPDVTNGAEIVATAAFLEKYDDRDNAQGSTSLACKRAGLQAFKLIIKGGVGVGMVTKPGLAVPVGEPAINPVPRKMIQEAVQEAVTDHKAARSASGPRSPIPGGGLVITISVPNGQELAKKTLNARLGIIGGISILGTSGIVRPLSTEAWTSSITASMGVAKATGVEEIVLSVGRVSERAHMKKYGFPEEAYVMMGDYSGFSLSEAKRHGFRKIHISAHWAKMLKISMSTPQTHVRHGAIDVGKAAAHLSSMGISIPEDRDFNTAREIYDYLVSVCGRCLPEFREVCVAAKHYAEGITAGIPVTTHLVSYDGDIIVNSE
jgi:cobalt-precorrin-5B (C1)-methyltransferase